MSLSPKQVRDNYENAIYGFKWYEIPVCRRSIKRKLNFWAVASAAHEAKRGGWLREEALVIDRGRRSCGKASEQATLQHQQQEGSNCSPGAVHTEPEQLVSFTMVFMMLLWLGSAF